MPSGEVRALASRLRALRLQRWPGRRIKQEDLAAALGVKASSVSTWESSRRPKVPPEDRLDQYATFFATERSIDQTPNRVLRLDELNDQELERRTELLRELSDLRSAALGRSGSDRAEVASTGTGLGIWDFPEGEDVIIVCARLSRRLLDRIPYTDPDSPDYVETYTLADPDALLEAFGHIRARNPANKVGFQVGTNLKSDDYASHLVLLGGVDWNDATRGILQLFEDVPVKQFSRELEDNIGGFEVVENGIRQEFTPKLRKMRDKQILMEDIAHVLWAPSPYNARRTVTICNGMYGRGVYGAVRAITDDRFRHDNQKYVTSRFGDGGFSILSRVLVAGGQVVTPNWSEPDKRLHEWLVRG